MFVVFIFTKQDIWNMSAEVKAIWIQIRCQRWKWTRGSDDNASAAPRQDDNDDDDDGDGVNDDGDDADDHKDDNDDATMKK